MNKYGNKKTMVDGFEFDSKLEAKRYNELKMLLKSGVITDLTLQKVFLLQDGFSYASKKRTTYNICLRFFITKIKKGNEIVEDAKGFKTDVYKIKRKLFLYKYPHIVFREVIK